MVCPQCQRTDAAGLVCAGCGAILPARRLDPFAAFGLPARFQLDEQTLEVRYRELQQKLHPDRFARAPQPERLASLRAATALNDAVRVLRDPLARAAALLETRGVTIGENESIEGPLVMEIMELREQLDDARSANDQGQASQVVEGVRARRADALASLSTQLDAGDDAGAKHTLITIRYFDRLLEAAAA
jgi:molecular chaperone HscB